MIVTHAIDQREPQSPMGPTEVVIEELQAHQPIPGVIAFGERMRLAGEGVEPITQSAIESFDMHRTRWLHPRPQRGADLHRQQSPMLITMLDRLRQRDRLWNHQPGTPPFARGDRFAVGPLQDAPIAVPAITEPLQFTLVSPLDRAGHRLLDQLLAQRARGPGDHEATLPILHQAAPALPLVGLGCYPLFFCTNAALLIDFHLAQVEIAGQHLRDGCCVAGRPLEPGADRLVFVPRDLFGRSQAASSHHD